VKSAVSEFFNAHIISEAMGLRGVVFAGSGLLYSSNEAFDLG